MNEQLEFKLNMVMLNMDQLTQTLFSALEPLLETATPEELLTVSQRVDRVGTALDLFCESIFNAQIGV